MKKQWRTLSVDEKFYDLVSKKQAELTLLNNGKHIQIGMVAEAAIIIGISNVKLEDVKEE